MCEASCPTGARDNCTQGRDCPNRIARVAVSLDGPYSRRRRWIPKIAWPDWLTAEGARAGFWFAMTIGAATLFLASIGFLAGVIGRIRGWW